MSLFLEVQVLLHVMGNLAGLSHSNISQSRNKGIKKKEMDS